jgi:hypothetical protein
MSYHRDREEMQCHYCETLFPVLENVLLVDLILLLMVPRELKNRAEPKNSVSGG